MRTSSSRRSMIAGLAAAAVGAFASPALAATPEPLLTLDVSNRIQVIDANNPTAPATAIPIRGLKANEVAAGLDYVAALGKVLLFTSTGTAYSLSNQYEVTPLSEAVTGAMGGITGIDWNPTTINTPAPRIRVVAGTQNFRWKVEDGLFINDGLFTPAANVVGAAYTNNDVDPATGTTLYTLDANTDALLVNSVAPAFSTVAMVGPTGVQVDDVTGFDISGATTTAYAAMRNGAIDSTLYTLNLATGAATSRGKIGGGAARVTSLTAVPGAFFPPAPKCGEVAGEKGLLSLPLGNIGRLLGSKQANPIGVLVEQVNCNIVTKLGL